MLNILVKDFKLLLFGDKSSIGKKILSLVFTALMLAIFIGIEVFLFTMIIEKVKTYKTQLKKDFEEIAGCLKEVKKNFDNSIILWYDIH